MQKTTLVSEFYQLFISLFTVTAASHHVLKNSLKQSLNDFIDILMLQSCKADSFKSYKKILIIYLKGPAFRHTVLYLYWVHCGNLTLNE